MKKNEVKLLVIGDHGSGKRSSLESFKKINFGDDYLLIEKVEKTFESQQIILFFRGLGEHTEYDKLKYLEYDVSNVIMICFSLVDENSLNSIKKFWIPDLKKNFPDKPFFCWK
jgi:GTPase SAR1 family protein